MREKIYIGALLVAIGTFHAATVRQVHLWADDFAMYVRHAKNVFEGHLYTDTNYIYNASMVVGPKYYRRGQPGGTLAVGREHSCQILSDHERIQ
jgi:hypothetical protein